MFSHLLCAVKSSALCPCMQYCSCATTKDQSFRKILFSGLKRKKSICIITLKYINKIKILGSAISSLVIYDDKGMTACSDKKT